MCAVMVVFTAQQFKASVRSAAKIERAILVTDQPVKILDMSKLTKILVQKPRLKLLQSHLFSHLGSYSYELRTWLRLPLSLPVRPEDRKRLLWSLA